jgi:hypothetical protein
MDNGNLGNRMGGRYRNLGWEANITPSHVDIWLEYQCLRYRGWPYGVRGVA